MFDLAGPYCGDGLEEPDPAALFLPRYALPVRWGVFDPSAEFTGTYATLY